VVVAEDPPVSSASSPVQAEGQAPALAETAEAPAATAAPASAAALDVREVKLIDDNGQQGLFIKLTERPTSVTHLTLERPTRLVIDIRGGSGTASAAAQRFAVKNPLVNEIRVARSDGTIRVTLQVRGESVPNYTVSDLNETVVAFLGEPTGGSEPILEHVVYTRRAGALRASADSEDSGGEPQPARRDVAAAPTDQLSSVDARGLPHPTYVGQHVSLDFKDADVHNVLRLLAEVSKLNIVATEDVRGKITLHLFDVPWDQALDIVMQSLSLESVQEGNVVRISTVKRLREEREELKRAEDAARILEPLHVDYIKVNYTKAKALGDIISGAARSRSGSQQSASRQGGQEEGVLSSRGSVFVDELSNTIIVRDIQHGIDSARDLVRRLDVQTPQVLIESSIIEATSDFARELGVQWGYSYLGGPQTGNPTGANFPGSIGVGGSGLGTGVSGIPFIADFPAGSAVAGSGSALNLALGSIDGSHSLDVRVSALERTGKARIVSRPRVVTLNNVAATIKSLTIIRVRLPSTGTVISTGAGGSAGGNTNATEKIETGIILVVTPQVSSDGFVLLDMSAKSSQADFTRTVDQIPTEITREANSHILVKSGQTVVLGGIYRDNYSESQTGLPYLQNIPGLGWLFRDLNKSDRREDLLVFMTPRIMGAPSGVLPSAEELWRGRDSGRED
jgi:type IV pilus secretin PilQ/predicted competence protein